LDPRELALAAFQERSLHAPRARNPSRALSGRVEHVPVRSARSAESVGEPLIGIVPLSTSRVVSERPPGHRERKREQEQCCR